MAVFFRSATRPSAYLLSGGESASISGYDGAVRNQSRLWNARCGIAILAVWSLAVTAFPRSVNAGDDKVSSPANLLRVHVIGLRNDNGDVRCSLYSSAEDFPTNDDLLATTVVAPISDHSAVCEFSSVAPGTYAVVVFHDENSDGKFNRNWLGMPKEGFGFSNDAPARWHPPKFDAASFSFSGAAEIVVHMRYTL